MATFTASTTLSEIISEKSLSVEGKVKVNKIKQLHCPASVA